MRDLAGTLYDVRVVFTVVPGAATGLNPTTRASGSHI
jgi:hypothetical protein